MNAGLRKKAKIQPYIDVNLVQVLYSLALLPHAHKGAFTHHVYPWGFCTMLRFSSIYLDRADQCNYKENASQCEKRTRKWNVATLLCACFELRF